MRTLVMRVIVNWPHALSSNHKLLNQLGTGIGVQNAKGVKENSPGQTNNERAALGNCPTK